MEDNRDPGGDVFGCLWAVPNVIPQETRTAFSRSLPNWMPWWLVPTRAMTLGLDLQGGSHVLLAVDMDDLTKTLVEQLRDDVRRVVREQRVQVSGGVLAQQRGVQIRVANPADREKLLPKLRELATPITNIVVGATGSRTLEVTEGQDGVIQLTLTREGMNEKARRAVEQAIEILRKRIDSLGTTEPNIQRQGLDRILVQVPGLQDPQRLKELLGRTAKLTFRLVDMSMPVEQALKGRAPAESEVLYGNEKEGKQPYLVERRVIVAGEDLIDAQPGFDQRTNEPIVSFRFNTRGARQFAQVTQQNVGRPFAIVLDNEVISAPRDPRAHIGWLRTDLRQLHRAGGQRSCDPAARRRVAGQAIDRRGAHCGPKSWAGLHRCRA